MVDDVWAHFAGQCGPAWPITNCLDLAEFLAEDALLQLPVGDRAEILGTFVRILRRSVMARTRSEVAEMEKVARIVEGGKR